MARISLPEGDQLDIVKALSLRPSFAKAVGAMNAATFASTLDWRLHELVRMRIAQINGCTVCLSWRQPEAVEAGLTEDVLLAVGEWRAAPSTHPSSTHPSSTHPSSAHPSSAHPSSAHPSSAHPSSAHPSSAHPSSTHPSSTHPSSTHPSSYSDSERAALEFTELFCGESTAISDELMARLETYFDAGEIVELALVIGKYLSQGRFMQVLGLDQVCAVPQVMTEMAATNGGAAK
jgi:AhpD family alkylhydroperoxidase